MGEIVPEPLLALFSGHSFMLLVSSITYIIDLVAPLSAEFLAVDVQHGCVHQPDADVNHPCPPRLIVRLLPARTLQAVLGLIAVLIILTLLLNIKRHSGVYSNPSSIAAVASLLHHPDTLEDFKELADADDKEVDRVLSENRYRLAHYQAGYDGMKYGIVPVMKVEKHEVNNITKGTYSAVANPESGVQVLRHKRTFWQKHFWRTLGDVTQGFMLLGLFGVLLGFYFDGSDSGFNRFFLSQKFGPKFVLVFAAGLIVTQWRRLERGKTTINHVSLYPIIVVLIHVLSTEVRSYQPYRHLSSKSSSYPTHTILSTTTSTPWSTLPLSLYHREIFTALVAFCYILSEVLVIAVATIPYSNNQYYLAFLAGIYIAFSILGLQIFCFFALVTWWRRTGPHLDRDPDTLLGVWTLLASSGIRKDFEDLGTAGRRDLVRTVERWDKRYWLGEVVGRDGVARMGIHADTAHLETRFEGLRIQHPDGVVSHMPFR
jgi:hypothetical protein